MPTLLEVQRAMRAAIIEDDPAALVGALSDGIGPDRLDIYRNTIFVGLTRALRLAFPAVERLVGAEFFEGAADIFIREHLPQAAYLDQYGDAFPEFLRQFPPAASLTYLGDVAQLEWAVNRALHAPNVKPLQIQELAEIALDDQETVSFLPHPSLGLIYSEYPADNIWRAVLSQDDEALAAIDLSAGPVFLLVERANENVEVTRMQETEWCFLKALCQGDSLLDAMESARALDAASLLAQHLMAGRFVGFRYENRNFELQMSECKE
jgi:hypothetical protein